MSCAPRELEGWVQLHIEPLQGLRDHWQGQDLVPEIKMLSPLSLFQAKCQESNYRRPRGLQRGISDHPGDCARLSGSGQAAGRWWCGLERPGRVLPALDAGYTRLLMSMAEARPDPEPQAPRRGLLLVVHVVFLPPRNYVQHLLQRIPTR